jgi:integrase/recombinase XerD
MVYCRLPRFVVEALEATPRVSANYWFWAGHGTKDTLTSCWRRSFRKVCKAAGIAGGHPHRLRDTFAVELLLAGVPIERVSVLLGHTSARTTEKHYAAWVQARHAQVEQDLALAWAKDPIAAAAEKSATYPLRGKQEVS